MIIPIYNGEQYIDKCLESIANQYYQNLEILCVVNGSTDASEKMVRAWMERDDRIKLLVTEIADLGHAANLGIDNTSGEYISFVDVDDWVDPEYISKLYAGIEKGYSLCKAN